MVPLWWGLAHSSNFISGWLVKQFNSQSVVDMIKKMGVKSEVLAVPSVFLGTAEMSLYELVGAYSAFANKGVCSQPIFVTKIEDKNGNLIANFQSQKIEAISEKTAYLMSQMLQFVVARGTAYGLHSYKIKKLNNIGGKTGTTQSHADGWFVSISPDLVSGVWVGGEELNIHFKNLADGGGSAMALPIYGLFLQKVDADKSISINQNDFERPAGFDVDLDCSMSEFESDRSTIELFE
jgi:penicillin-binding protein 1A